MPVMIATDGLTGCNWNWFISLLINWFVCFICSSLPSTVTCLVGNLQYQVPASAARLSLLVPNNHTTGGGFRVVSSSESCFSSSLSLRGRGRVKRFFLWECSDIPRWDSHSFRQMLPMWNEADGRCIQERSFRSQPVQLVCSYLRLEDVPQRSTAADWSRWGARQRVPMWRDRTVVSLSCNVNLNKHLRLGTAFYRIIYYLCKKYILNEYVE